jgi:mannose-6-phosphate isomerase
MGTCHHKRIRVYPLKFRPVFQERMWGGQRLRTLLNKPVGKELKRANIGESWELADLPPGTVKADSTSAAADGSLSSIIANGPLAGRTLHAVLRESAPAIMGETPLHRGHFPLLIKFLDARENLSVQVHPDSTHCAANPGSHLKNEAWYILHAAPGARIYKGLKAGVTKTRFREALHSGEAGSLLNIISVRAGDCHYLPSGTVHALGAGILAAEVQTPSDTTFRVFDWNRLGADGQPRKLHVEEALSCMQFDDTPLRPKPVVGAHLASCDHFTIERVELGTPGQREIPGGEPRIWIALEGQGVVQCEAGPPTAFTRGDTLLLPASLKNGWVKTVAPSTWLEVCIPVASPQKGHP